MDNQIDSLNEYKIQINLSQELYHNTEQLLTFCKNADCTDLENIVTINNYLTQRQELMENFTASKSILQSSASTNHLQEIIDQLIVKTAKLDHQITTILQHKQSQLKTNALQFRKGRNVCQAYKPTQPQHEGFYLDKKPS